MGAYVNGKALLDVLVVSLLTGTGLVALFAVGMVGASAAGPSGAEDPGAAVTTSRRLGRTGGLVLAVVCFGVVAAGVGLGLWTIIAS